jgi:NADPH:quinone reductase-like Zn-dependent oxidoreductase
MKAVRINEWGKPVQIEEVTQPAPGKDEVLVRVRAASVNPVDVFVAAGALQSMLSVPMTLGTDFAGEVVSVGADVKHVRQGDAVYGMRAMQGGIYAEYTVAKAHEVAAKPRSLDFAQAAAVPLAGLSAWQTLNNLAQLQAGERVLIHGAAGGVGTFAVQLAKAKGAYVIASDKSGKESFLRQLGADEVITADRQPFEEAAGKVDVVLDLVGGDLVERSFNVLKPGGRYVTTAGQPSAEEAARRGIQAMGAFTQPSIDDLTSVARLIDAGKLKVIVNRTFPMHETQVALAFQQQADTRGKVVITV